MRIYPVLLYLFFKNNFQNAIMISLWDLTEETLTETGACVYCVYIVIPRTRTHGPLSGSELVGLLVDENFFIQTDIHFIIVIEDFF